MGSLPELRRLAPGTPSPPPKPRHSFGAATVLQVRHGGQTLVPALLEAQSAAGNRRRESCASSVGATSVRRLVRGGTSAARGNGASGDNGEGEAAERWRRRRSALAVCGARAVAAAALLPLQALQGTGENGGNSTLGSDPGGSGGASLLASLHLSASVAALVAPAITKHARATTVLPVGYLVLSAFCAAHLYPELYILLPAYIAAGACWTPLSFARDSLISTLACSGASENLAQQAPQRRTLLRRLSRASRAARDLGLLVASLLLPLLTPIVVNSVKNSLQQSRNCVVIDNTGAVIPCRQDKNATLNIEDVAQWKKKSQEINMTVTTEEAWPSSAETEDENEEWREKECGANGCPKKTSFGINSSIDTTVAIALCTCCLLAACCSAPAAFCSNHTTNCSLGKDPADIIGDGEASGRTWTAAIRAFKDIRMRTASPLALFIGLEQGFLYSHFLQWYVVCVSGDGQLWRALAGAALLRALVATTLSMLLAHGRRKIVASVGLTWHACLLLAMSTWRAARADKQLPLVMAAAWAGCDAVWEMLLPTLIDEPVPGGRTALCFSLRSLGLSLAFLSRAHLCVNWAIRPLILALPAGALPLIFAPDP